MSQRPERTEVRFDRHNAEHMELLREGFPELWRALTKKHRQPVDPRILVGPFYARKIEGLVPAARPVDLVHEPGRYLKVQLFIPYEFPDGVGGLGGREPERNQRRGDRAQRKVARTLRKSPAKGHK